MNKRLPLSWKEDGFGAGIKEVDFCGGDRDIPSD